MAGQHFLLYKGDRSLVVPTAYSMLEVDCVFDGETEFPPSPYEPKHEREE
ncbi:MAG: hypothetical protein KME25_02110 [Symplocastrum torsivum CPER-KK1]|uniref:Uncharacterized protein n=1 Tax=Symplocastrum torsivum CPER-KK1 TaxID=450513 RepID=A0A951PH19_9CYAN|nr:hypothetical protein [Symplocastrum torsivum CPER-KK1]